MNRTDRPQASSWWPLAGIVALAKLAVFVFDSNPQVLLGDSMSYLATAVAGWIPPDRSFLYGFIVHDVTSRARSLSSLIAVQTLAGIGTALLTAWILVRFFKTPFRIAAVLAVVIAIEPQQLLYERFVLTESLSTAVFAAFLFFTLEYVHAQRIWALVAVQIAGVLLIALRMTFFPIVVAATVIVPVLAHLPSKKAYLPRRMVIQLLISVSLLAALHASYRRWNGNLSKKPSAYLYSDGFFLLGTVSPLVTPADTTNPLLTPVLAQPLAYANGEARLLARGAELYQDEGLVARIKRTLQDDYLANAEAKRIAYRAMLRDPIGVVSMAVQTSLLLYSRSYMNGSMRQEAGMRELEPGQLKLLSQFHVDAKGLPFMKTLTRQYYLGSWPWFLVVFHTPILLLVCVARTSSRRLIWFLVLVAALQTGTTQLLQVEPSTRYLHPTVVLFAIAVGIVVSSYTDAKERRA